MDESTQQNAALVEQAAAASESIVQQVRELNASVTDDGDASDSTEAVAPARGMSGSSGGRCAHRHGAGGGKGVPILRAAS
jgi:hypothetical protein